MMAQLQSPALLPHAHAAATHLSVSPPEFMLPPSMGSQLSSSPPRELSITRRDVRPSDSQHPESAPNLGGPQRGFSEQVRRTRSLSDS